MKIINESKKEKLPVDFITSFVGEGWNQIGSLKSTIKMLDDAFTGSKKVKEILDNFIDNYLVAIGQMETLLADKYLDIPEVEELTEQLVESSPELAQPIEAKQYVEGEKTEVFTELPDYEVEVEQKGDKIEIELEPKAAEDKPEEAAIPPVNSSEDDTFDIDFEEPDLIGNEGELIQAWRNR